MSKTLPLLTALRGFAALMVVFFHARLLLFPQWKTVLAGYTQFFENGYLWVDLFFILSGLVMAHVYQHDFAASLISWRRFLWLRLTRIYPLFILTLLVLLGWESYKWANQIGYFGGPLFNGWGMAGIPAFEGPFNQAGALWQNILLVQVFSGKGLSWNVSAWSLSVEWFSYLVFPLMLVLVKGRYRAGLAIVLCLGVIYAIASSKGNLDATEGGLSVARGLAGFTLGLALQRLIGLAPKSFSNDGLLAAVCLLPLVLLHFQLTPFLTLAVVSSFVLLVFVAAVQQPRQGLFGVLENRFSNWLGDLSYSLYLWHAVILLVGVEVLHRWLPVALDQWYAQQNIGLSLLGVAAVVLFMLLVSAASYYQFERPLQSWLRKRVARKSSVIAMASR